MSNYKKVVISANNTDRARAFFAEVKARKAEAFKKIDARTEKVNAAIIKQTLSISK